jgi:hypothetical protein
MLRLERFLKLLCLVEATALCLTVGVYLGSHYRLQQAPRRSLGISSNQASPGLTPAINPGAKIEASSPHDDVKSPRRANRWRTPDQPPLVTSPSATAAGRPVNREARPGITGETSGPKRATNARPAPAAGSPTGAPVTTREESAGNSPEPPAAPEAPPSEVISPGSENASKESARPAPSRPSKGKRMLRALKKVGKFLIR